ncbi:phytoene/squalene synthase family protein [Salarchaeum japonicum]|uniref:Phytoene/squalene synthase family protein n=1 Tax=Salarchaeum japonicum TaxID=555573 RepID=A0AAV3SYG9_9EURY|nr:phytoene/squalene synthase family protein [Salarchaeum japonicum]
MVSREQVATAKSIHRRTGKTFYLATRLLPERVRRGTYVLYGFFRVADEVVDGDEDRSPDEQRAELERIREGVLGDATPDDPVLAAFADVKEEYGIPDGEVEVFLDAMEADIEQRTYETAADLDEYMRGSAVSVGHMMVYLMDPERENADAALPHAGALGKAFQLTNFIRDVREDIDDLDRVYVPMERLRSNGVTIDQLRNHESSKGLTTALQSELSRAESLYREGVAGIKYLPRDCQFPVLLAAVLYAEHHRLIRQRGFDVLSDPPSLSLPRKLYVTAKTSWRWWRNDDPEAVFDAVSAVPADRAGAPEDDREREEGIATL